jgi:RecB family endonuclease NucS
VVVELKLNEIGRGAINQLRRYIRQVKKDTKKQVRGVIVCRDIMPAFIDEFRKLSDIQIFRFGWKLTIYPKKWD